MIGAANDVTRNRITANCRSHILIPTGTWDCNHDSCDVTQEKAARDRERVAGCDASGLPTATYYFGEGFCMHSPDTVTKIEARDLLGPFHHPRRWQ
jgi:hypothetical protein